MNSETRKISSLVVCLAMVATVFIVMPLAVSQEPTLMEQTFTIVQLGGTSGTQSSPQLDYSVEISTAGVLGMQYFVNVPDDEVPGRHCSDIRLRIFVDDTLVRTTDWMGYASRAPSLPLDTGKLELGPCLSGTHTLTLSPEGREGGCNIGTLDSWGGTLVVQTSLISAISAMIDIDPDTLNLKSNGEWITAYIELPEGYDVNDIDVSTIYLVNTIPVDTSAPATVGDYDSDGTSDLMVKFDRTAVVAYLGTEDVTEDETGTDYYEELTITGELTDGTQFEGSDTIRVIDKGKSK